MKGALEEGRTSNSRRKEHATVAWSRARRVVQATAPALLYCSAAVRSVFLEAAAGRQGGGGVQGCWLGLRSTTLGLCG